MVTAAGAADLRAPLVNDGKTQPITVGPWDTLRSAAEEMAKSKLTTFPVVDEGKFVGILNVADLLTARGKASLRDSDRQRVLRLRWPFGETERLRVRSTMRRW
jgi:CBS domain-containing protein